MNGHAYAHYIDHPTTLFRGWNAGLIQEQLYQQACEGLRAGTSLSAAVRSRLSWYPSLVATMVADEVLSGTELDHVLSSPSVRFRALCNDYASVAERLEPGLMEDEETVERLVRWLSLKGITPRLPLAEYLVKLRDPNRLYRMTPIPSRPSREKLLALADERRLTSPEWAFIWVSNNHLLELGDDLIAVLVRSEEYAYLAAYIMKKRGVATSAWSPLLEGIRSHRWSYHAMVDLDPGSDLGTAVQEAMVNRLHSSPPWAVQFWEARRWKGEQLAWAYDQCRRLAGSHECTPELHSWVRMARATQSLPATAAVAKAA